MYIPFEEIKTIQLDHTSRCNLMCPQCARVTHENKLNPRLEMRDLTIDDYKIIFTPFIGKKISILHCGNYGDVIASPTFDETFQWTYDNGFRDVHIITNGSARTKSWWENLAKHGPHVTFSIDGLEDTNHIYRVNSNFKKIKENAEAFINAGGRARWDYLVFDHNQHQIEEARELAKDLGFISFQVKNTSRFISQTGHKAAIVNKKSIVIHDIKNNQSTSDYNNIVQTYGSFEEYVRVTPISCKYKNNKTYYIDFTMRLWPCCWVGAPGLFYAPNAQTVDMDKVTQKYGIDFNRLDLHGWDNTLSHEFYTSHLENSWLNKEDRIYTCGRTCGDKFEFSSAYGKNSDTVKLHDNTK